MHKRNKSDEIEYTVSHWVVCLCLVHANTWIKLCLQFYMKHACTWWCMNTIKWEYRKLDIEYQVLASTSMAMQLFRIFYWMPLPVCPPIIQWKRKLFASNSSLTKITKKLKFNSSAQFQWALIHHQKEFFLQHHSKLLVTTHKCVYTSLQAFNATTNHLKQ